MMTITREQYLEWVAVAAYYYWQRREAVGFSGNADYDWFFALTEIDALLDQRGIGVVWPT